MKFFPTRSVTEFLHVVPIQSFYCLFVKKGLRALSYIGPSFWSNLKKSLKTSVFLNAFKHNLKDYYFRKGN